ncbi:flagella synthesis protein FlgN [Psychrobium sp. 1_MG-2023]|uniref:flagella synthesis protein FlgN n=1 Tax=Psychrobium sp. 1_MG-2023 TaxID=3062624 RepID=UPI000C346A85|nr:flagellar protein FlgN [Psychrobium sp. 1_MG-2023]MDP2559878.1 flagellar protein FlgN [Psychrobium sp. 1_MG-2023]PKF59021.1 flagellar protein FlgN [Alteromonadales bacterium alter-6D02]
MNIEQPLQFLSLQITYAEQLLTLLAQEEQALIARQYEAINQLAEQKQQLIEQLQQTDQQLANSLPNPKEFPAELQSHKEQVDLLLKQCQEKNQQNGKAIALGLNSLERLQGSLIQKRAGNSMTYTAKGKTRGGSLSGGYVSA